MAKLPPFFPDENTEKGKISKERREKAKQTLHEVMAGPRVVGAIVKENYKHITGRHDGHKEAHHESNHKRGKQ